MQFRGELPEGSEEEGKESPSGLPSCPFWQGGWKLWDFIHGPLGSTSEELPSSCSEQREGAG